MSFVPRYVAPAGAPIRAVDLARWLARSLSYGEPAAVLQQQFRHRFGAQHAFLTTTGRAGMTVLFRALRRLAPADRDEVVVPSYTCYSVAASAVRAGLRPRVVDVSPDTLDYDFDDLARTDFSKVLAIVATNLYGLPNDLPALARLAKTNGVFLIDDAAQAMRAIVGGRMSGTWGDAGLYSFDKGKNVAAIDGGVIVTASDSVAHAVAAECEQLPVASLAETSAAVAKALIYAAMLRPWLYWIPNAIPQLELGKTVYTTAFAIDRPSRALTSLASTMMPRLDHFTDTRIRNAQALLEATRGLAGIRTIRCGATAMPVYLRLPILVGNPDLRRRIIATLNEHGIGATGSYPASLADVEGLRDSLADRTPHADGGRQIAKQIVTLPTHAFVHRSDIDRIAALLSDLTERSTRTCAA
jgi:perosamine synthetase